MNQVHLEYNGIVYETEYFCDEGTVTVFSESGKKVLVDVNEMSVVQAAREALKCLIDLDLASPKV